MQLKGQQNFKNKFDALPKIEQDFLKILATAFEVISVDSFYKILQSANIYNSTGRSIGQRELESTLYNLKEKEWVDNSTKGEYFCIESVEKQIIKEAYLDTRFPLFLLAIREILPAKERSWMRKPRNFTVCIRELQIALLQKDKTAFHNWLNTIKQYYPEKLSGNKTLAFLFEDHFEPEWIATFPDDFQYSVLENIIFLNIHQLKSIEHYVHYLETHKEINNNSTIGKQYRSLLGNAYIFQGKIKDKDAYFRNYARMAWVAFLVGDNKDAIELFEKALESLQKISGQTNIYFHHAAGPFYLFALLKRGDSNDHQKIINYCEWAKGGVFTSTYTYISAIIYQLKNKHQKVEILMATPPASSFDYLIKALVNHWIGEELPKQELAHLKELHTKAKQAGFLWIEMELAQVLGEVESNHQQLNKNSISPPKDKTNRLVWLLDMENEIIQPKEQTLNKSGSWSKGRNTALKRLVRGEVACMNVQDHKIVTHIGVSSFGYYGAEEYAFHFKEAIQEMVDHPYVFRYDNPTIPIELITRQPELLIDEKGDYFEFYFAHPIDKEGINPCSLVTFRRWI